MCPEIKSNPSVRLSSVRRSVKGLYPVHPSPLSHVYNTVESLSLRTSVFRISAFHCHPFYKIVSTLHDRLRHIWMRSHVWQVAFPHSPAVVQITLSAVKLYLSLSEIECFHSAATVTPLIIELSYASRKSSCLLETNAHVILIRSNKMQQYAGIYLLQNHSTHFGCPSHPSSGGRL
jgi:hypothetical protein